MRVVRFYDIPPPPPPPDFQAPDQSVPRRTSKLRIRVFPAGPRPQAPDQSVPHRTSASSGSECSPPDLHRKLRRRTSTTKISEDIPDTMPKCQKICEIKCECQIECQKICLNKMSFGGDHSKKTLVSPQVLPLKRDMEKKEK